MNTKILLLALGVAGLTSCATSYKTGQTPDDVYYSPAPKVEATNNDRDDDRSSRRNGDEYYDFRDRAGRMKSVDYRRWSSLDDPYYFDNFTFSPAYNYRFNYAYGYSYNLTPFAFNNFYGTNPGWWGGPAGGVGGFNGGGFVNAPAGVVYSNAYCPIPTGGNNNNVIVGGVRTPQPQYNAPRGGGSYGYNNSRYNNTNSGSGGKGTFSNGNNGNTGGGGLIRRVFSDNNSGGNNNSGGSNPVRSYSPSSSGGSSGGSGGGGGGVSRPVRNGG
jgi:hypothetical protein